MKVAVGHARIALIMNLLAVLAVLGVLTLAFQQLLDERNHPNRSVSADAVDGTLEIRLEANQQGHYLADGTINGQPVTFLVDTGATSISIPGHLADRLDLERGIAIPTATAGGRVTSYATTLESVSLGGIRRQGINATINPRLDMDQVLLGMNFLGPLDISQRNGVLRIRAPAER